MEVSPLARAVQGESKTGVKDDKEGATYMAYRNKLSNGNTRAIWWVLGMFECVVAPCAHCVRAVATNSGQTPLHHPKMHPLKGGMIAQRVLGACPARYLSINYPDFSPRFTL